MGESPLSRAIVRQGLELLGDVLPIDHVNVTMANLFDATSGGFFETCIDFFLGNDTLLSAQCYDRSSNLQQSIVTLSECSSSSILAFADETRILDNYIGYVNGRLGCDKRDG
jgi:hypothetical protein